VVVVVVVVITDTEVVTAGWVVVVLFLSVLVTGSAAMRPADITTSRRMCAACAAVLAALVQLLLPTPVILGLRWSLVLDSSIIWAKAPWPVLLAPDPLPRLLTPSLLLLAHTPPSISVVLLALTLFRQELAEVLLLTLLLSTPTLALRLRLTRPVLSTAVLLRQPSSLLEMDPPLLALAETTITTTATRRMTPSLSCQLGSVA
jgi:hypothetical protein